MRRWPERAEFLLRVRNELQFHAGQAQDVLDRAEQVRQAQVLGFSGTSGLLPVEQFMREYFRNTSAVLHIVPRFVEGARHRGDVRMALAPVLSRRVDGNYRIGPRSIWATRAGIPKLQQSLDEILHLAELASKYDRRITHQYLGGGSPGGARLARRGHVLRPPLDSCRCWSTRAAWRGAARSARSRRARKIDSGHGARAMPLAIQRISQVHGRRALPAGGGGSGIVGARSAAVGGRVSLRSRRSGFCIWRY